MAQKKIDGLQYYRCIRNKSNGFSAKTQLFNFRSCLSFLSDRAKPEVFPYSCGDFMGVRVREHLWPEVVCRSPALIYSNLFTSCATPSTIRRCRWFHDSCTTYQSYLFTVLFEWFNEEQCLYPSDLYLTSEPITNYVLHWLYFSLSLVHAIFP